MNPDHYKIIPVETVAQRRTFARMTIDLYKDDPHFIQPLDFEIMERLNPEKNPLLKHAQHQLWTLEKDGQHIGRIGAIINPQYIERYQNEMGHFGYFEVTNDPVAARLLMETVQNWHLERGMTGLSGPYNFSVNQECGLLIDGFERPPTVMMPHGKPYYAKLIEGLGFEKAADMYALWYPARYEFMPERRSKFIAKLIDKPKIKIRPFDFKNFNEDIRSAVEIFNNAWANNWGFVPLTDEEARHMASELRPIIAPYNTVMCVVDDKPAAFGIVLPNINEIICDFNGKLLPFNWAKFLWRLKVKKPTTARMPLMGILQEFQGKPLGAAFAYKIIEMVNDSNVANGLEHAELSWILESNQAMLTMLEDIGGVIDKTYRIYDKKIDKTA